jgi:hypothetical protein
LVLIREGVRIIMRSSRSRTRGNGSGKKAEEQLGAPVQIGEITPDMVEAVRNGETMDIVVKSGMVRRVTTKNGKLVAYYKTPSTDDKWVRMPKVTNELLKAFDPDAYGARKQNQAMDQARNQERRAEMEHQYEEEMRRRKRPYLYGTKGEPTDVGNVTPDMVHDLKMGDYQDIRLENGDVRRVVKSGSDRIGYWDRSVYESDGNGGWKPSHLTPEIASAFPSERELMQRQAEDEDRREQKRIDSLPKAERQKALERQQEQRENVSNIASDAARRVSQHWEFGHDAQDVQTTVTRLLSACDIERMPKGQTDDYTSTLTRQYVYFASDGTIEEGDYGLNVCSDAAATACDGYRIRLGDNTRGRIIRKAIASGILQNALYPNQEFEALNDAGVNIKQDDAYLD